MVALSHQWYHSLYAITTIKETCPVAEELFDMHNTTCIHIHCIVFELCMSGKKQTKKNNKLEILCLVFLNMKLAKLVK